MEEYADVSEIQHTTMSPIEKAATLNHQPSVEASPRDVSETGQPVWEMELVMEGQQDSPAPAFHSIPSEEEEEEEEVEDLTGGRDGGDEEIRTVPHGYECVPGTVSLSEKLEKTGEDSVLSHSVPLEAQPELSVPPPIQDQSELFDPQTLVSSCEISDQRTSLEGSQVSDYLGQTLVHTEQWTLSFPKSYSGIPLDARAFCNGSAARLLRVPPSVDTYHLRSGCVSERSTARQLESLDY